MHKTIFALIMLLILAACAPSEGAVQTAMAKTQAAYTPTPAPTSTTAPSKTPKPTNTPRPTPTRAYCSLDELTDAKDDLGTILLSFMDIAKRATEVTSSAQYAPLIRDLEDEQTELAKIEYPPCMADAILYISSAMDEMHEALSLALDDNFLEGTKHLTQSNEFLDEAINEVDKIVKCAPNCLP